MYKKLMGEELAADAKTNRDKIGMYNRAAFLSQKTLEAARPLVAIYEDADGERKAELDAISGEGVFTAFYDRLRETREYWRKLGSSGVLVDPEWDVKPLAKFSAEENEGVYLDLEQIHDRFLNMPMFKAQKLDYLKFLNRFDKLPQNIPKAEKLKKSNFAAYKKFMEDIAAYLVSYFQRTHPLVDMTKIHALIDEDFAQRWNNKEIAAWTDNGSAATSGQEEGQTKAEGAENNDSTNEQKVDTSSPLYCKACAKQFAKDSVFKAHLDGKKHKKAVQDMESGAGDAKQQEVNRELAAIEDRVIQFAELLRNDIQATTSYIEKKQTRSYEEMTADQEARATLALYQEEDKEEEDENTLYNPKNVPLGWDGKPIPYWLYKLHGLNIEYKCEICGGFSYFGPRNFERHFKEWRHVYGLKCLGITQHLDEFVNVIRFEDAVALNDKIQRREAQTEWKPDDEEEYEDREGNVYSKKQFDELKRQGII